MDFFYGLIQFFQENKNHKQKPVSESDFPVYALNGYSLRTEKTYMSVDQVFYSFSWIETPGANGG
jgi:hypothetical protein